MLLVVLLFSAGACADGEVAEHQGATREAEHAEAAEEREHSEAGEEDSSVRYARTNSVDEIRRGIRLRLHYDSTQAAFVGTVENVSKSLVERVRVEVHLTDGPELGPTTPTDLGPGERAEVSLPAGGLVFETWTTHAETGRGEHGAEGHN